MIDRLKGPAINNDFDLTIRNLKSGVLSNGIKTFEVNNGTQDIIKIDLVFKAGHIGGKTGNAVALIDYSRVEGRKR